MDHNKHHPDNSLPPFSKNLADTSHLLAVSEKELSRMGTSIQASKMLEYESKRAIAESYAILQSANSAQRILYEAILNFG